MRALHKEQIINEAEVDRGELLGEKATLTLERGEGRVLIGYPQVRMEIPAAAAIFQLGRPNYYPENHVWVAVVTNWADSSIDVSLTEMRRGFFWVGKIASGGWFVSEKDINRVIDDVYMGNFRNVRTSFGQKQIEVKSVSLIGIKVLRISPRAVYTVLECLNPKSYNRDRFFNAGDNVNLTVCSCNCRP